MKNCPIHPGKKISHKCKLCQVSCCEDCGTICKQCLTKIGVIGLILMCVIAGIIFFGIM
ncbi:MAG: hypothetical protein LUQ50_07530 [Methanospirillum sp.]|uniref:hypothetical protein n=1 Tax=Methanospirillum sp. TaxID=45200 RepID=UPI0023734998|nr:hypothetical protein [Methanospirillum sp.]MDD1728905.1 hypothetical protein [Methanospirillum sp.]